MRRVTLLMIALARNKSLMIALSLAMLGGMIFLYDPREVVSRLHNVKWVVAIPAIAGLAAIHLLQVEVWRVMSVALNGIDLSRRLAATAYFGGQLFGGMTPGNLGGDFYRTVTVKTTAISWRAALGPILGQRMVSYGSIFLLAVAAGYLGLASHEGLLMIAAVGGALCLAVFWVGKHRLARLLIRATERFAPSQFDAVSGAMSALQKVLGLGIAFHLGSVGLMYALLVSIGETPPFLSAIGMLLVARAISLLPVTPYGLGLQEGSLVLLLPGLGIGPESALAVSLLGRLGMILVVTIGLGCFLAQRHSSGLGFRMVRAGTSALSPRR